MRQTEYKPLEDTIHLTFPDRELLENVFIHRSFLNENRTFHLPSNEKLEFLGDSVLSLITSIFLYKNYPDLKEGDYTDIKASIVRTESLAEVAAELNLGQYLYLSRGEEQSGGRSNINILADCFEAVVACIFLQYSFDKAYDFVVEFLFGTRLGHIVDNKLYLSPKSRLQEIIQAKDKVLPIYTTTQETGPEHQKEFIITVSVNGKELGQGKGNSKKHAEEAAAKDALEKME